MRLLVVDDEKPALDRLKGLAEACMPGSIVDGLSEPKMVLDYVTSNTTDVVFLDINMPGISGMDLAKYIKEISPKTYIIFCTAYAEYAVEAFKIHANGYLLKPVTKEDVQRELDCIYDPKFLPARKKVVIQTFGNFDVFVDDKLLDFKRSKSKEMLAYLIDNKGANVTAGEISDVIWEDGFYDRSRQKQFYAIMSDLKKTLNEAGVGDILIKTSIGYCVDKTKIDCDYYRFLDGDLAVINKYEGKYMFNYSWAEFTTSYLDKKTNNY